MRRPGRGTRYLDTWGGGGERLGAHLLRGSRVMLDSSLSGISKGGILVPRHDRISRQRWTIRLSLSLLFPPCFSARWKKKKTRDARLIGVNTGSSYFLFSLSFSIFNFFLRFSVCGLFSLALYFVFSNQPPPPSPPFFFYSFQRISSIDFCRLHSREKWGWNIGQGGMECMERWKNWRVSWSYWPKGGEGGLFRSLSLRLLSADARVESVLLNSTDRGKLEVRYRIWSAVRWPNEGSLKLVSNILFRRNIGQKGEGYFRKINFECNTHGNFVCIYSSTLIDYLLVHLKKKNYYRSASASGLEAARFEKLRNNSDETRCIRHSTLWKRIERGSIVSRKLRRWEKNSK